MYLFFMGGSFLDTTSYGYDDGPRGQSSRTDVESVGTSPGTSSLCIDVS